MSEIITDKAGRKIQLRRVGVLEQLRLFKALGPELSLNLPYLHGAMIAASIEMLDDVPVPFPVNEAGVESILERIGLDAMGEIAKARVQGEARALAAEAGN
jgi:hypothetical protein